MKSYDFGFVPKTVLRLSRIEEILRQTRIIDPIPSRKMLIELIEDGTLVGHKVGSRYLVDEESFKIWVRSLHPQGYEPVGSLPMTAQ